MKKYIVVDTTIYYVKGRFDKKEDAMEFARLLRISEPDVYSRVFEMIEK